MVGNYRIKLSVSSKDKQFLKSMKEKSTWDELFKTLLRCEKPTKFAKYKIKSDSIIQVYLSENTFNDFRVFSAHFDGYASAVRYLVEREREKIVNSRLVY